MSRNDPPRRLSRILAADAQIGAWHERMEREARLTTAVRRVLPRALADRVRVARAAAPTVELAVAAGAVAAAVRQRAPDVLAGLRREGWDFNEIEVRVQVAETAHAGTIQHRNQSDRVNPEPLRALARRLPGGPLRDSVERLARRG
jgi:hypothetical protein